MEKSRNKRKQTSPLTEVLSSNMQLLPLIVDNIPQPVFWKDQNLVYLGCNQAFAKDAGLDSPTQVIGKTDYDMPWTDQAEQYREDDAQVMENGEAKINEVLQSGSNGEIAWLRTSKIPIRDDDGNVIAVLGMHEDITAKKQAEQLLKEHEERLQAISEGTHEAAQSDKNLEASEQRFQTLFEHSADAYLIIEEGKFVDCNQATVEMLRANNKEEVLNTHPSDLSPETQPDGRSSGEKADEMMQIALEKGSNRFEWTHRRLDGEDFPVEVLLTPIPLGDKTLIHTMWRDITHRKKAQAELLREQMFSDTIIESLPGVFYIFDTAGKLIRWNKNYEALTGYNSAEADTPPNAMDPIYEEDRELTAKSIEKVFREGYADAEIRTVKLDTGEIDIYYFSTSRMQVGDELYAVGSGYDITDRKRAEAELRQEKALSDAVINGLPGIFYMFSPDGSMVRWNEEYEQATGYNTEEMATLNALDSIADEDKEITLAAIERVFEEGQASVEAHMQTRDGKRIPYFFAGRRLQVGDELFVTGTGYDITDRNLLESQLQEAFDRRGEQVQISTEITQEISQASELSELFDRVVTLTKERLGYYHTQLLRYEPGQDAVVLITGYGKTGAQMLSLGHSMPLGSGLIGTAAESGKTVMRPDLAIDPDWQPNPLLPETKGEIAVPIKLGDEILGVLDVQSDQAGALTEDDQLMLEGLCGQIAIAMDQTRLRQEMEERLTEINRLYQAMSREGWESYTSSTSLPEGFQYDQSGVRVVDSGDGQEHLVSAPLTVPGGHTIGTLSITDDPDNPLSRDDRAFLRQVSEQVALALESARLSEQTQEALARTDELYNISQAMNEGNSEAEILEALAQPAAQNGAVSAILMYLDLDEAGKPEWTENVADWRVKGQAPIPVGSRFYLPEMPLSKLWMADPENPLLISDVMTDARVDEIARGLMEQSGSLALAIIPLTRGGEQIGMLIFNWDQPHEFSSRENETYRAIIDLASPAVQSRRLFEQTQSALTAVQESETQLSEALEIAKLGYWEYDFANDEFILTDNFYSIFHTTAEAMGGYRMSSTTYSEKFVHPEDASMVGEEIERSLATTERFFSARLEHRILYQDGGEGYISVNINLERDEKGNITRWYGANQDITERRQAEEAVRLAQERAQTILETVTLPMVITRLSDNILTFANPPAAEIVGIPLDELVDSQAPDFYANPDERTQFITELQSQGFVNNMQVVLRRGDQSTFWALLSSRIFTYQGEPSILTTITDISERIKAQEATAKRAAELATVAEVGTTISTILEEQPLIETVVQQTRERFALYHCHIFLADAKNQTLQVKACGWEADSPHAGIVEQALIHTDQEQSLVAQAARDQKAVIVNDVRSDPNWLPNELLPETRAEMAVPLIAGKQVLGVLDVQSDEVGRFTDEDVSILTTLASQVAVALQNSRTYAQTQQQAEYEAMINQISQRIQSTTNVENALQVAIRELGRALGAKRTNIQLGLPSQKKSD